MNEEFDYDIYFSPKKLELDDDDIYFNPKRMEDDIVGRATCKTWYSRSESTLTRALAEEIFDEYRTGSPTIPALELVQKFTGKDPRVYGGELSSIIGISRKNLS